MEALIPTIPDYIRIIFADPYVESFRPIIVNNL